MKSFLDNKKLHLTIIIFLTALVYSNIFANGFTADDKDFILDWQGRRDPSNIIAILKGAGPESRANAVYRPIRGVLYLIYYQIWGTNSFGYHLHGIIVTALAAILVYLILEKLLQRRDLALIGALLFGLHPVHSEAVTFMTSSMDMLGPLFFLAAFYFYIVYRQKENFKLKLISLIFAFLAFFSNEVTLFLPLAFVAFDFYFGYFKKGTFLKNVKLYVPYFSLILVYLFLRIVSVGKSPVQNAIFENGHFNYVQLLMPKAFVKYIELLIMPMKLSINHYLLPGLDTFSNTMYQTTKLDPKSFFDFGLWASVFVLMSLFAVAIIAFKKYKLFSFGIIWFFIALLPISNIFGQPTIMSERYIFLASLGFIFAVIYIIGRLPKNISLICSLVLVLFYGGLTFRRNFDWRDEIKLWKSASEVYPKSGLAYYNLADLYSEIPDLETASSYYKKTIEAKPTFYNAYFNLADVLKKRGLEEEAILQYKKVLEINHSIPDAYFYLGDAYFKKGEVDLALATLLGVEKYEGQYLQNAGQDTKQLFVSIYNDIGVIYQQQGQKDLAKKYYEKALALDPGNKNARNNIDVLEGRQTSQIDTTNLKKEAFLRLVSHLGFSFEHPDDWKGRENERVVVIKSRDGKYTIEVAIEERGENETIDAYLKKQTKTYGNFVKNGYIEVENFDKTFARRWEDGGTIKSDFFLFKGNKVVRILVNPSNSNTEKVFDEITNSFEFK